MATTRESIRDGLDWTLRLLGVGARRAVIIGICAGLFAVAVLWTTRERVSDCGDVTDQQREVLAALVDGNGASIRVESSARCTEGEYAVPIVGLDGSMEMATASLIDDGFAQETEYIAYGRQVWRRCFSRAEDDWQNIQLIVDATRGGEVVGAKVVALEAGKACDPERRDVSTIYPPRS